MYRIPDFLLEIDDPRLAAGPGAGIKGCPICGGTSITAQRRSD
jgi:hypothetical protein